ncbi:hypothetical protein N9242_02680 [Vicingaceae bacterium]|nr:hypothetical protein [Vicingaceae bacterium]
MKKILMATLVASVLLIGNDCYAQSFKEKLKAKAAAAAAAKSKSSTPAKSNPTTTKGATAKGGTTFYLMEAERGKTKVQAEEGELNGKKIIAINGAPYTYQDEPSKMLSKNIYFTTAGIYVIEYDENSWVSVMPDKQLGKAPFGKFTFSNFYSSDASKAKSMTKAKAEAYATDLSKKILAPSSSGPSKGGNGTYSAATPVKFSGKAYGEVEIEFIDGAEKKIIRKAGGKTTYLHMPEFSKIAGVDVYTDASLNLHRYIYVDKPGVLIWTRYKSGALGTQLWGKYDQYNMYAMDKQIVRGLLNSESQQKELDAKVAAWTKKIKTAEDKRRADKESKGIENQRLPKRGLVDAKLEAEGLTAAKGFASKWNWKETLTRVYFSGADWGIRRHKVTGIQTGRSIKGVIVMTRPDGLCSYHDAVFAQEFDGTKYRTVYFDGILGAPYKLNCEHTK